MESHDEIREMFSLPRMPRELGDDIGLKEFEDYLSVELPVKGKLKREQLGKHTPYKPRGISFTSEADNPNYQKWKCLECGKISSAPGLGYHQNKSGHKGKQRVFETLESLGVVT